MGVWAFNSCKIIFNCISPKQIMRMHCSTTISCARLQQWKLALLRTGGSEGTEGRHRGRPLVSVPQVLKKKPQLKCPEPPPPSKPISLSVFLSHVLPPTPSPFVSGLHWVDLFAFFFVAVAVVVARSYCFRTPAAFLRPSWLGAAARYKLTRRRALLAGGIDPKPSPCGPGPGRR